ncbi:Uncharacterised protein [Vibrio cholerae]|nr:Uncharacterised protein [Vibrio cholerae]
MDALPRSAAETAKSEPSTPPSMCPGRKGARCDFTPIGPMPGPPPPCGIQKVLCKFRCDTSEPIKPGEVSPTCAFMFAPSR